MKRNFIKSLAVCAMFGATLLTFSCKDKNEPNKPVTPGTGTGTGGEQTEVAMTTTLTNDTTIYLLAGESYKFSYEIVKGDVAMTEKPEGWDAAKKEEEGKKVIEITAPASVTDANKVYEFALTHQRGTNVDKVIAHFKIINLTERGGVYMLCRGRGTESSSMSYITADGMIVEKLYERVNKVGIDATAKDFFMHHGKGYILSETGTAKEDGSKPGKLVVVDLNNFKKVKEFNSEDLSQLSSPRYVAALDEENIYIMDKASVWHLNATSKALTKVEDTNGTPDVPFAVQNDKLYYIYETRVKYTIREITSGQTFVNTLSLPYRFKMGLSKIVDLLPSNDGKLFMVGYFKRDSGFFGTVYCSVHKIDPANSSISKPAANWINKPLNILDPGHKISVGSNGEIYYNELNKVYKFTFDDNANPTEETDPNTNVFLRFVQTPEAVELVDYSALLGVSVGLITKRVTVNPVTNNVFAYTYKTYMQGLTNKSIVELDGNIPNPTKPLRIWKNVLGNGAVGFYFNK